MKKNVCVFNLKIIRKEHLHRNRQDPASKGPRYKKTGDERCGIKKDLKTKGLPYLFFDLKNRDPVLCLPVPEPFLPEIFSGRNMRRPNS